MDIAEIAARISAQPTDIPGLWSLPGYPELTTGQLLSIASARAISVGVSQASQMASPALRPN